MHCVPHLTAPHKVLRLVQAKQHYACSLAFCKRIIFSNKERCAVDGLYERAYLWKVRGRLPVFFTAYTVRNNYRVGRILRIRKLELKFLSDDINGQKYTLILKRRLLSFLGWVHHQKRLFLGRKRSGSHHWSIEWPGFRKVSECFGLVSSFGKREPYRKHMEHVIAGCVRRGKQFHVYDEL